MLLQVNFNDFLHRIGRQIKQNYAAIQFLEGRIQKFLQEGPLKLQYFCKRFITTSRFRLIVLFAAQTRNNGFASESKGLKPKVEMLCGIKCVTGTLCEATEQLRQLKRNK